MTVESEIHQSRAELEPLTNEQLILRSLASLVSHNLPDKTYYKIMASVLRERGNRGRLSYEEKIRLKAFDYIRQGINDILLSDPTWFDKKEHHDKSGFERGVRAAMALITHRIDCILD